MLSVSQADLKFLSLLSWPPECWNYTRATMPSWEVWFFIKESNCLWFTENLGGKVIAMLLSNSDLKNYERWCCAPLILALPAPEGRSRWTSVPAWSAQWVPGSQGHIVRPCIKSTQTQNPTTELRKPSQENVSWSFTAGQQWMNTNRLMQIFNSFLLCSISYFPLPVCLVFPGDTAVGIKHGLCLHGIFIP